jgi:hypothetical protein
MRDYARWLRSVLTSRGMCSRHLSQSFEAVADAIRSELPNADAAFTQLRAACDALRYESGPERELEEMSDALARALETVAVPRKDGHGVHDVLCHLSYAADAIHLRRPQLFAEHVRFWEAFLARRSVLAARFHEEILALGGPAFRALEPTSELSLAMHELLEAAMNGTDARPS